jgi:type IV pilus assembly protein PilN
MKINLLPWRKEKRIANYKHLLKIVLLALLAIIVIIFTLKTVVYKSIQRQILRNSYLEKEIKSIDYQYKLATDLKKKHKDDLNIFKKIHKNDDYFKKLIEFLDLTTLAFPKKSKIDEIHIDGNNVKLKVLFPNDKNTSDFSFKNHFVKSYKVIEIKHNGNYSIYEIEMILRYL